MVDFKIGDKIMGFQVEDQLQRYSTGIYAGVITWIEEGENEYYGKYIVSYRIKGLPHCEVECIENSGVRAFDEGIWSKLVEARRNLLNAEKEFYESIEQLRSV